MVWAATETVIWLGVVFISLRLPLKTPADYVKLLQIIMSLARRSGTAEPTSAGSKCAGGIFACCVKKIKIALKKTQHKKINKNVPLAVSNLLDTENNNKPDCWTSKIHVNFSPIRKEKSTK